MVSRQPPPARPSSPVAPRLSPWHQRHPPIPPSFETSLSTEAIQSALDDTYPIRCKTPPIKGTTMLPLLLFADGDTLVYIDPPPENGPSHQTSSSTTPHRIHSEKLLATGSAYLSKLFQPRAQARVAKQRGFHGWLPAGIKYLLDLTPPILEEDAIIHLTEVSCPSGIRTWAKKGLLWNLPSSCVGGIDICEPVTESSRQEITAPSPPPPTSPVEPDNGDNNEKEEASPTLFIQNGNTGEVTEMGISTKPKPKPITLPVEYSAVRHREGIEHILHALEGLGITLNTPCKLWTFFAIAKIFDVATVPTVSGYILSWFYESSNSKFIELHPDIAYRVASGIKAPELCRHAFLVLVGDEALLHTIRSAQIHPLTHWIENFAHSRITGFLEDIEVQRIEYASKSFTDDLVSHFLHLAGAEMSWLEENDQYQKLLRHRDRNPEDRCAVEGLVEKLREFVRYRIYCLLRTSRDPIRSCDAVPETMSSSNFYRTFSSADVLQRLIGRSFWYNLLSSSLFPGMELEILHESISDIGTGLLAFKGQEHAKIRYFDKDYLQQDVNIINQRIEVGSRKSGNFTNSPLSLPFHLRPSSPCRGRGGGPRILTGTTIVAESNSQNKPLVLRPHSFIRNSNSKGSNLASAMGSKSHPDSPDVPVGSSSNPPNQENPNIRNSPIDWIPNHAHPGQPPPSKAPSLEEDRRIFDLTLFLVHVTSYIRQSARALLFPVDQLSIPIESIDTLSCLTEAQLNLLPLWAGGNDDGSGGVYNDQDIPNMEIGGFTTPGPAVHTGSTASTENSFSDIGLADFQSTVQGASHHATYSHLSCVLSVDSFDEESIMGVDAAKPEETTEYMEPSDSGFSVDSTDEETSFDVGGADSHSNSTVMGHQSDISDFDMEHPDDINDDNDHDDNDQLMNAANSDEFEMIDEHL